MAGKYVIISCGNVSSVGNILRIEVASKIGPSSWARKHISPYHTTHNIGNFAICNICCHSEAARMMSHTEYEVLYSSKKSTSKLTSHLMHNHHAVHDANTEKIAYTFIASCGIMENHVVYGVSPL